jgi:hypothetical protein
MVWPTTSAENADVAQHLTGEMRVRAARVHQDAVQEAVRVLGTSAGAARRDEAITPIFARMVDDLLRVALDPTRGTPLAASLALADPEVARRVQGERASWQETQGTLFLASMQLVGVRLDAGIDVEAYSESVFAGIAGSLLVGRLHPVLMAPRVSVAGTPVSLFGVGAIALLRGMAEGPGPTGRPAWLCGRGPGRT